MLNALIAGGSLASGLFGSSAAKSAAKAQAKSAQKQLKFAKKIFRTTTEAADETTGSLLRTAQGTANRGRAEATAEYNALEGTAGRLRDVSSEAYGDAYNRGRRDLVGGRDAAIDVLRPTAARGDNALAAYGSNLGLNPRPTGYSGPRLSEGERFIRDEGMTTVQGSAAARGGLNSGATLEALSRLGAGVASQSRDRQQSELFALGGLGQTATGRMADLYSGTGGNLASLSQGYGDRMAGVASTYAAGTGAARAGLTDRRLGLDRGYMNDATQARGMNLNALVGAGSQLGGAGADALAGAGNARAAGAVGSANAWTDAINTGAGMYGYFGGQGQGGGTGRNPLEWGANAFGNLTGSTNYRAGMPNGGAASGPMARPRGW